MTRIIVIPAYEPDDMLIKIAEEACNTNSRVIVVDDGSGNDYFAIFNAVKKYAHVISYENNHGKGYALKTAYKYIAEQYKNEQYVVVTIDSDGQHSIKDALRVLDMSSGNLGQLILGSRIQSKSSPLKSRIGNGLTKLVYIISTGVTVNDTQTGLRAFDSSLMELMMSIEGERYEYEMNVLMELPKKKIKIKEIPIETIYIDNNSGTHFRPIKDSISIYMEIIKYSASSFIGFLVDYILFTILITVLGQKYLICSNIFARIVSATTNFMLNYKYVFNAKESIVKCALKYILLAICVLMLNSALLYSLVNVCGVNALLSKVCVEIIMFIVNWLVQHFIVFRNGGNDVSL